MLKSFQQVKNLSRTYGINEEDILLIALNASGLRSNLNHSRIRFHLLLRERPEERFNIIYCSSQGRFSISIERGWDLV